MKAKYLTTSNLITAILVVFMLAMFLNPDFKGLVMQNLMKIGLFQPKVPDGPGQLLTGTVIKGEDKEIMFKSSNDEIMKLADQKGKVVFINFWATWCPPCIAEMPSINKLYAELRKHKEMMFVMVDVDNNRSKSQKFMDRRKFSLPVYTPTGPIPSSYMDGTLPTTLVLDKQGRVVFKHEGMGDFTNEEFKAFLVRLIAE
ncbi:MAG: TlpA family protein disulfide reductase [Daejeonella sp.]|uniref:TlpA family protein disulfide reductase n=1 Tax=Daejeonella sp. JGW-45 TaxID=3034148 RepID=UPI0023EB326B|nr:TlpA disulfide reductase family protein [Daejeonella sp. JGW-45]